MINIGENIIKWVGLIKMITNQRSIPVIGCIGNITLEEIQLGIEAGINDYIFQDSSNLTLEKRLDIIFLQLQQRYPYVERRLLCDRRHTLSEKSNEGSALGEEDTAEIPLVVDSREKMVYLDNKEIFLSPTEFELLEVLLSDSGRVFSAQEIIQKLWPNKQDATPGDVQQYVFLLRKKLRDHCSSSLIKTVKGFGYKLDLSMSHAEKKTIPKK